MNSQLKVVFLLAVTAMSGCSTGTVVTDVPGTKTSSGLILATQDAASNVMIIRDPKRNTRYCLSPETDGFKAKGQSLGLSLRGTSVSDGSESQIALAGGFSPAVHISREVLYRACELTLNYPMSESEAVALFHHALKTIENIAANDSNSGTASIATVPPARASDDDVGDTDDM